MPEKPIRQGENWKQENQRRRASWPFINRRCERKLGDDQCEHLQGHPGKCITRIHGEGKCLEW